MFGVYVMRSWLDGFLCPLEWCCPCEGCAWERGLCVWLVWRCVKIGQVCFCGFVGEIWRGAVSSVRIPLVCSEWWLGVESWWEWHNSFTGGWDGTETSVSTKNCFVSACQSTVNVQISRQCAPCLNIRLIASTYFVRYASDITNIDNLKTTFLLKDLTYFSDIFASPTRRWVTWNFKILNWIMATFEILMHVLYSWIHGRMFF